MKHQRLWLFGTLGALVLVGLASLLYPPTQRLTPEAQEAGDEPAPSTPSGGTAGAGTTPPGPSSPAGPSGGGSAPGPGVSQPQVRVADCVDDLSPACTERALQERDFALAVLRRQVDTNPRAQRYMRAVIQQMQPFEFVGQVVDTQGNPVAGAEVVYQLGYPYSLGYTQTARTKTDAQGQFQIQDRAWSLFIRTIEAPGLIPAPGFTQHREFSAQNRPGLIPWHQASASQPYRFVLRSGRAGP